MTTAVDDVHDGEVLRAHHRAGDAGDLEIIAVPVELVDAGDETALEAWRAGR